MTNALSQPGKNFGMDIWFVECKVETIVPVSEDEDLCEAQTVVEEIFTKSPTESSKILLYDQSSV